jgi:hypothetical protein
LVQKKLILGQQTARPPWNRGEIANSIPLPYNASMRRSQPFKPHLILKPPDFSDPNRTQTARQIFAILRAFILSAFLLQIIQIAMAPEHAWRRLGLMLAAVAVSLAILALTRRGHVQLAAFLLVS